MTHRMAVLAAALLLGCGSPSGPGGLDLSFQASRATIEHGQTVMLTLTVENLTDATITVSGSSSCTFGWEIVGQSRGRRVCTADIRSFTFEPLQSRVFTFEWSGYLETDAGLPVAIDPATYELRGVIEAQEGTAASRTVAIVVTAPDLPTG